MPLYPPEAGNRARAVKFIDLLEEAGSQVVVFYADIVPGSTAESRRILGNRFFAARFRARSPKQFLKRSLRAALAVAKRAMPRLTTRLMLARAEAGHAQPLDSYFDEAVLRRLQHVTDRTRPDTILCVYAIWGPYMERLRSTAIKIVDTQDRLGDRHIRVPGARGGFSISVDDESRAIGAFDRIVAIQDSEADYFRTLTDKPVISIGHISTPRHFTLAHVAKAASVGFIGANNPANRAALQAIIGEIWPRVLHRHPGAVLLIAGNVEGDIPEHSGVSRLGFVSDISDFYSRCRILLNPVPWGTGQKIKVVEAIAHGVPVVTTPHGAEGLPMSGAGVVVGESAEDLAGAALQLLLDNDVLAQHHAEAIRFYSDWQLFQRSLFAETFNVSAREP